MTFDNVKLICGFYLHFYTSATLLRILLMSFLFLTLLSHLFVSNFVSVVIAGANQTAPYRA